MVAVGIAALLSFRGLYGRVPLLLSMGLSVMTAFVALKLARMFASANVRFQNLQLRRGNRWTPAGATFVAFSVALLLLVAQSGFIQYNVRQGRRGLASLHLPDSVWFSGNRWWDGADPTTRASAERAIDHLELANRIGLTDTPAALQDLVWLQLAKGDLDRAESTVRRLVEIGPSEPDFQRGLAGVLRRRGRLDESEERYRQALDIDPHFDRARSELAAMLQSIGRYDEAILLLREGIELSPGDASWSLRVAEALMTSSRFDEARTELTTLLGREAGSPAVLAALGFVESQSGNADIGMDYWRRALEFDPMRTEVRYNLALALLHASQPAEAIEHLERVVADRPDFAAAHYNLAVAVYMQGSPAGAVAHAERAVDLAPDDPQAKAFLTMLRDDIR